MRSLFYGSLGQPMEVGRDQEHCTLGIADLGVLCQVAWNQGTDLFGYANNRLLAGVEYLAAYNLGHDVPTAMEIAPTNICSLFRRTGAGGWMIGRFMKCSTITTSCGRASVRRTFKPSRNCARPERDGPDHFGYGTLTHTLNSAASPYPPAPVPAAPTGLVAQPGPGEITLSWTPPPSDLTCGYQVSRATSGGGPYTTIASWTQHTLPTYTDATVVNGATYYYVVAAQNQSGVSVSSAEVSATPALAAALPNG